MCLVMSLLVPALGAAANIVPLLLVVDRQDSILGGGQLGGGPIFDVRSSLFVQPDGGLVVNQTTISIAGEEVGPNGIVFRGRVGQRGLADLQAALIASRIGSQRHCHTSARIASRIADLTWQVSWIGRGNRHNSFIVSSDPALAFPECSSEARALVDAILKLTADFESQPATDLLTSQQ